MNSTLNSAASASLARLAAAVKGGSINAYSDEGDRRKRAFHSNGKVVLRAVAAALGLAEGSYDIRSNKAGIAVCGEVTLHAEGIYIQLSQGLMGDKFMYRSCKGRKDYTGGTNCWMSFSTLTENFDGAIGAFRAALANYR